MPTNAFAGALQAAVPVVRREVWPHDGHLIPLEKPAELVSRLQTLIAIAERQIVPVPQTTLQHYTGNYAFGSSTATIALKSGRLILQLSGDADVPLFADSEASFFVRTTGTEIRFDRNSREGTTAMIIQSPGAQPIRCPRIRPAGAKQPV